MTKQNFRGQLKGWQMILIAVASCLLWFTIGLLPVVIPTHVADWYLGFALLSPFAAVLIALVMHYKLGVQFFVSWKGLALGLVLGWPIIGQAIAQISWTKALFTIYDWQAYQPMFYLVLIQCLLTGLEEELMFRGVLLGALRQSLARFKHNNLFAIGISAVAFGAMHLANLTEGIGSNQEVIEEVLFAIAIGIFLGTIYLVSHNLVAVMLLHAIQDIQPMNNIICRKASSVHNYSFDWSGIISGLLLIVLAIALSTFYWWLSSYLKKRRLRAAVK